MSDPTIGFIGVGTMGNPMAKHVADAGLSLIVHDTDRDAVARVAEATGAAVAETPRDVAQGCDIAVTMLPTGADVRAVALGSDGLADGFAGDGTLIDMSSSEPAGTVALANELATRGVAMIDAPVSGGLVKALDGTLTLMVGGEDAVIDRCLPVLEAIGGEIFRTGPAGSGHAVKAINNLLNAAGYLIATEGLLIGKRFGVDPGTILDVINVSTGMNHSTRAKFRQQVLSRDFAAGFTLDLMVKDLDIALGLARATRTPAPYAAHCREVWATALLNLGPGRDHTELARWLEQTAHAELTDDA